jgi:3-oxoacyl-[acyl-carrier-protein] synthase II
VAKQEVVITGLGIVSPYGCDVKQYYDRLAAGEIALKPTAWAPESGSWFSAVEGFDPLDWMPEQVVDGTDRFTQFALAGAKQALADAGLESLDPLRTAVVMATSMGGTRAVERSQHLLETAGPEAVPRKLQILIWPNMAAAQIAMTYKLHGPFMTVTTACAGGVDAIGTAARFIELGMADVAITGATEGSGGLDYESAMFASQRAYGMTKPATDPTMACRPFDRDRTGIAGCEGAGMFVVESREHAEARGAAIHAVVRGYSNLADAYHPSSPNPSGEWEALVMRQALERAALPSATKVTAVYAHGTGTPKGDMAEIRAINDVYADRGRDLLVTSLKGHMGHPGSSAAAMNIVAGVTGMARGEVLPTASTKNVDPEINFELVLGEPRRVEVQALQFNAFGFGGQNASVVLTPD